MIPHKRRLEIMKLLEEEGSAEVSHLAKLFKVTEVTIRKDLEKLESDGLIIKEHGGAFLKMQPDKLLTLSTPTADNLDSKQKIGRAAAAFVKNGDTVIIDSGTTTTELAKQITDRTNLTVITTSLSVALHLGSNQGIAVHMTGGEFKAPTFSLTGSQAAEFFANLHVEKLFLSAMAMSFKTGLTYSGISDVIVKKAMIKAATKVILLADSSKFEKQSFASVGDLSVIHMLITDAGIRPEHREALEKQKIEVVIAE
jgi:DeoR/GlpR family transcriptional regulator of sugar metabolism